MARFKWEVRADSRSFLFFCPGCDHLHVFVTPDWVFNGDESSPTFTPSLLNYIPEPDGSRSKVCHLFLTDGRIQFLDDCHHSLAGKNLPLVDCFTD